MYTFITALVFATSFACFTPEENKTFADISISPESVTESEKVMITPIFKIYGELSPVNYLNGGEDELTLAHGFLVERVAGCRISSELEESVKENNRVSNELMMVYFGENWKADFEEKTGVRFVYTQFR